MAKSSRSKWKRTHRRILAANEKKNVDARLSRLHKKLELTVKGAITSVPLQDPERRFHFVNPAVKQRTNDLSPTNLNTNAVLDKQLYGVEDGHRIDFSKPLQLPPPTTNYYGKSNPDAPHPVTVEFETLDALAPVAGRALTKDNVAWLAEKAQRDAARAAETTQNEEDHDEEDQEGPVTMSFDVAGDAPEEYVFGMDDASPRRVTHSGGTAASGGKKKAAAEPAKKIATARVTSVGGNAKMKAVNGSKGAGASRVVSSGSKAAKKASKSKK